MPHDLGASLGSATTRWRRCAPRTRSLPSLQRCRTLTWTSRRASRRCGHSLARSLLLVRRISPPSCVTRRRSAHSTSSARWASGCLRRTDRLTPLSQGMPLLSRCGRSSTSVQLLSTCTRPLLRAQCSRWAGRRFEESARSARNRLYARDHPCRVRSDLQRNQGRPSRRRDHPFARRRHAPVYRAGARKPRSPPGQTPPRMRHLDSPLVCHSGLPSVGP